MKHKDRPFHKTYCSGVARNLVWGVSFGVFAQKAVLKLEVCKSKTKIYLVNNSFVLGVQMPHSGNTEQGKCRLKNEYLFFLFFIGRWYYEKNILSL
jgi:hypothetical protein